MSPFQDVPTAIIVRIFFVYERRVETRIRSVFQPNDTLLRFVLRYFQGELGCFVVHVEEPDSRSQVLFQMVLVFPADQCIVGDGVLEPVTVVVVQFTSVTEFIQDTVDILPPDKSLNHQPGDTGRTTFDGNRQAVRKLGRQIRQERI